MTKRSQRPVWLGEDRRGWDHVRVHVALLHDERIGAYELAVYCGLAAHAELTSGDAWPSLHTVAGYAGMSVRKARDAVRTLEAAGWVHVSENAGAASTYRLLPPPTPAPRAALAEPTPAPRAAHPGTTRHATPAPGAAEQEPVNENQEREKTSAAESADVYRLGDGRVVELSWSPPAIAIEHGRLVEAIELCELLGRQLADRGERIGEQPHSKRWVLDMEQMLRLDERTADDVARVLRWLDAGNDKVAAFWRINIRSPGKLRERWITMREQYEAERDPRRAAAVPKINLSSGGAAKVAEYYDAQRAALREREQAAHPPSGGASPLASNRSLNPGA